MLHYLTTKCVSSLQTTTIPNNNFEVPGNPRSQPHFTNSKNNLINHEISKTFYLVQQELYAYTNPEHCTKTIAYHHLPRFLSSNAQHCPQYSKPDQWSAIIQLKKNYHKIPASKMQTQFYRKLIAHSRGWENINWTASVT